MTTQHTGNERGEIQGEESAQETGHNPEQSADDLNSEDSEKDQPEPAEVHEGEMERSLSAPTPFNSDTSDLYSEWKHWVSAFGIYSIALDLFKNEDDVQRATLLHCLSPAVQRIFNTLPGEHKSFEEVKTALDGYFVPKRNVAAELYKFRS